MAKATKFKDRPHARIYSHWRRWPAWALLSLAARALLVEILLEYRPGNNGRLSWPCRRAASAIGVSKDTASRALKELELKGWLTVERVALFGRRRTPAEYALTMYVNDLTGEPASKAFEHWTPDSPVCVASQGQRGRISGTKPSQGEDTDPLPGLTAH
jgi:Helix-turn-helix domain